jgi:hypothetical protein
MKILFLHGWTSTPGGRKPTYTCESPHKALEMPCRDGECLSLSQGGQGAGTAVTT